MEDKSASQLTNSIDFRHYLLKLLAHWYLFVIALTIGISFKYIDDRFRTDTYASNATMILHDDFQNTQAAVGSLEMFDTRKNYETEFGILKSYSLNKIAISELDFEISYFKQQNFRADIDLYKKTPFIVEFDSAKFNANYVKYYVKFISETKFIVTKNDNDKEVELSFNETYNSNNQTFKIKKNPNINVNYKNLVGEVYYFYKNDFNNLVLSYKNRLNVDLRSPNSSILWLWTTGKVPERIVDYLNKLSEVYMRQSLESKNRVALNTIKFIDEQLQTVSDSLGAVEHKLRGIEKSNQALDIAKNDEMLFEELERLREVKKRSEIKQNFYKYLEKNLSEDDVDINIVSPYLVDIKDVILEGLLAEYQKLKSEKEVLKYDVKRNIPQMDLLNLKLKQLKNRLSKHIAGSQKTIAYNIKENSTNIDKLYAKLRKVPAFRRAMSNIQREYKLNDNIYTFLLEKRTEAGMTMASNSPGAKILDMAMYQNVTLNSSGKNSLIKIILICLIIPIILIEIKSFFNNKIIDRSDVEKQTSIPILSSISHNSTNSNLPVFDFPKNPISESFRLLKTNLKYLLMDKKNAVISINSTVSGEGKTFCSANLAILFAMLDKKVIIIGLDLRKPRLHLPFNNDNAIGLSTYLIGANSLDEVVFSTEIKNLSLLPSGPVPPNPAELLESEKMTKLIERLRKEYDYIIIDTAPVAHVADSLLITKFVDASIFVIRQNHSTKNVVKIIEELHNSEKMQNMGLVINDVNPSMIFGLKYGYGFDYGYNYGYGYGQSGAGYYDNPAQNRGFIKRIIYKVQSLLQRLFE